MLVQAPVMRVGLPSGRGPRSRGRLLSGRALASTGGREPPSSRGLSAASVPLPPPPLRPPCPLFPPACPPPPSPPRPPLSPPGPFPAAPPAPWWTGPTCAIPTH